jgi:hypothetical protein
MVGCSEFCRNFAFAIFFLSPLHRKHHYLRLLRKDTVWKKERKNASVAYNEPRKSLPDVTRHDGRDPWWAVRGYTVLLYYYQCQHRSMGFHTAGSVASQPPVDAALLWMHMQRPSQEGTSRRRARPRAEATPAVHSPGKCAGFGRKLAPPAAGPRTDRMGGAHAQLFMWLRGILARESESVQTRGVFHWIVIGIQAPDASCPWS